MKLRLQSLRFRPARAAVLLGVAAALVLLAAPALHAQQAAAPSAPPPRLSVLMGVTGDWQQSAQAVRAHDGTLLGGQSTGADLLPAADPFTAFNAPTPAVRQVARDADERTESVRPAAAEDAPVLLPDSARPADAAASGFAPTTAATAGYSHAAFAADMLAAPARAHIASELRGDWLGHLDDARPAAATVVAERAPQGYTAPTWTTTPAASFVPASYVRAASTPTFSPTAPTANTIPAAVAPVTAGANGRDGVSGTAYGWGLNGNGQVGNGTTTNQTTPTPVQGLPSGGGVTSVASGGGHTLFVVNGAVYAVGANSSGQLGIGTTTGTSGTNYTTAVPALVLTSGVTAVAGGFTSSLAIQNGALFTWGRGDSGVLGNGTSTGLVTTPTAVSGFGSGVTLIAGNQLNSYAVRNGALFAAGANTVGQLGNGTTLPNGTYQTTFAPTTLTGGVTGLSTGQAHVLAIQNGALYSWGINSNGQLGNGTTTNNPTPTVVGNLGSGVTSVAAGYLFSLAVQNGSVFAWGNNQTGQLGLGTNTGNTTASGIYSPVQVPGLSNIIAVAAAGYCSYALDADGSLWVWGRNNYGQLGLGDLVERDSPVHLLPPSGFYYSAIDGNGNGSINDHAVAILSSGTPVPEPATWAGGALLLAGAGWTLRRRRAAAALAPTLS